MPAKKHQHPFAAKLAELRQPHDASLRKILDTADEVEAKTGQRPDVRARYEQACRTAGRCAGPLPEWFR